MNVGYLTFGKTCWTVIWKLKGNIYEQKSQKGIVKWKMSLKKERKERRCERFMKVKDSKEIFSIFNPDRKMLNKLDLS